MKYSVNNIDDNRFELTITVEKDDYVQELDKGLKEKRKNAELKGFRKGKTPMGFIKKTFGNSMLAEVVNKKIDSGLNDYLKDNKIELLLTPMAADNQKPLDININDLKDFDVFFDLYKRPEFEVRGISPEDEYTFYKIPVDEKDIDAEQENLAKRFGKYEPNEGETTKDSLVTIYMKELENGELKEGGYETESSIIVNELKEEYQTKLLAAKIGEEFDFDAYEFLQKSEPKHVRDYLLNIDEKDFESEDEIDIGKNFRGELKNVEVFVPAKLDEEFFKQDPSSQFSNLEEYREGVKKELGEMYAKESNAILFDDIAKRLKELNDVEISEEYLKKWLTQQYSDKNQEEIEKELLGVAKEELKWQSIVEKLTKQYDVEIKQEELYQRLEQQVAGMMGGNPEVVKQMMDYVIKDEKYVNKVYNEMFFDKLFTEVAKDVNKVEKTVSHQEFTEMYQKRVEESKHHHDHDHDHDHDHEH